jgi:hypothetical protein
VQWLWKGEAIKAHAVFVFLITLLSTELLVGNRGPAGDYLGGLVFCAIGYPIVLLLLWFRWRVDGGVEGARHAAPGAAPDTAARIGSGSS